MSIGPSKQAEIASKVRSLTKEQRAGLREAAMAELFRWRAAARLRILSAGQRRQLEEAIETIVRVEALDQGKGWWFRTKRRARLIHRYAGLRPQTTEPNATGEVLPVRAAHSVRDNRLSGLVRSS